MSDERFEVHTMSGEQCECGGEFYESDDGVLRCTNCCAEVYRL